MGHERLSKHPNLIMVSCKILSFNVSLSASYDLASLERTVLLVELGLNSFINDSIVSSSWRELLSVKSKFSNFRRLFISFSRFELRIRFVASEFEISVENPAKISRIYGLKSMIFVQVSLATYSWFDHSNFRPFGKCFQNFHKAKLFQMLRYLHKMCTYQAVLLLIAQFLHYSCTIVRVPFSPLFSLYFFSVKK